MNGIGDAHPKSQHSKPVCFYGYSFILLLRDAIATWMQAPAESDVERVLRLMGVAGYGWSSHSPVETSGWHRINSILCFGVSDKCAGCQNE
jgi:hypothetical protein